MAPFDTILTKEVAATSSHLNDAAVSKAAPIGNSLIRQRLKSMNLNSDSKYGRRRRRSQLKP
jgi:hypothetical protein